MALRWLHRDTAVARLAEAIVGTPRPPDGTFAWVAGEFQAVQRIRRHLERTWMLDRSRVLAVAYWRR